MIGQTLAHYEILDTLGSGGMGVVYRARDTKLKRDVAIKVLSERFAGDRERMARFEREARVLASLNHPNIAAIYGLEETDGVFALVMELVEGQTLAQRIERGALELEEAIDIATQVAAGLDAAHAKGIIHRDLKPANVMITEDGTVKVLDFGLAKALEGDAAESVDDSNSPTLSRAATQAGVLLGTAGYMSPEQARGKPVDKRADIWALGVVLFEMLTGTRLFDGETMSDTLAAVLKTEPDWTALPAETPWLLKRLLRRCLAKNQKERLHDVADVRLELQDAMTSRDEAPRNARRTTPGIAVSGGVLVGLLVGAAIVARFTQRAPESPIRFSMEVPVLGWGPGQVALSRDGRSLAFGSRDPTALYHRSLGARDDVASSALAVGAAPFFSPDGRWIGFRDGTTLKKVATSGGAAVSICECDGRDYHWDDDDVIWFASRGGGLMRVSANGGEPESLLSEDDTERLLGAEILPGKETLLTTTTFEGALWVTSVSVATPERKRLVQGHSARYLEPGFLIFARGGVQTTTTLFAARFDASTMEIRGELTPVAEDVSSGSGREAQFAIAANGTLVYAERRVGFYAGRRLVWVDREGLTTPLLDELAGYRDPRLSPDGSLLAYTIWGDGVWVYDVVRGVRTLVQEALVVEQPAWTPDGDTITFVLRTASEGFAIYSKAADGSGEALQTVKEGSPFFPDWSPDGRVLFYRDWAREQIRALSETGEVSSLVTSEGNLSTPRVSPDGGFIAYVSDNSGREEVYVVPFPQADRRHTISTDGGYSPVWSRDGRELFYVSDDRLMTVAVETADGFRPGTPRELFRGQFVRDNSANYDVALDGERFVMVQSESATEQRTVLHFVVHFDEELRQRLP